MKIEKNLQGVLNSALNQIDMLGFRLDELGVDNQINRHTLIAALMFGQKRLEGEMDSVTARVEANVARLESIKDSAEKLVSSGVNLALFPAKYTLERVRQR